MEQDIKVTYIIPIHEYNKDTEAYLSTCLKSLKELRGAENHEVFFVGQLDVLTKCQKFADKQNIPQVITMVPTNEEDVFEKINLAVSKCITPYFSVLEFDDYFYPYWNEVAQAYLKDDKYSILLPLNENHRTDGTVPSLGNEIAWDAAFATNIGEVDKEELLVYKDFNVTGALIKTEDFLELGKLDSTFKLVAWYEYLLRTVGAGKKIYVIPRIGYVHTILREGSYMLKCEQDMTTEEVVQLITKVVEKYKPEGKKE